MNKNKNRSHWCSLGHAKCLTFIPLFQPHNDPMTTDIIIIISISQMSKIRLRKIKGLALGSEATRWHSQDSIPDVAGPKLTSQPLGHSDALPITFR